ncbi:MAG: aldo/keto reductase [Pseudoclavibacter sp.]|jgi:aryl-alcohol dehydrogenase-like predicted oxidoreductase
MKYRDIGPYRATAISYGCMALAIEGRPGRDASISVLHRVLDAGITHLDVAWSYYLAGGEEQYGERLVADALRTWDGDLAPVSVATKVGHTRVLQDGVPAWGLDGAPDRLKLHAHESARALGVDAIDLLYLHRPDPAYPYEDELAAMADLVDAGLARTIGISNVNPQQIRTAHRILGDRLVAVQNEFSPTFRTSRPEIEVTGELGLAFIAWSPLGAPYRRTVDPALFVPFDRVAATHGVSTSQVVLAWELAQGPHVIPIPASHRPETILDSLQAADLQLSADEIAALDAEPVR